MLKISKHQLEILGQIEAERFVTRMVTHSHRFFGEQIRRLGESELHQWIVHGISRANTYGFVTQRDICHFLNLMFTFGRDFDIATTEHAWATRILRDSATADPASRMRRLCAAAFQHLQEESTMTGDSKRGVA